MDWAEGTSFQVSSKHKFTYGQSNVGKPLSYTQVARNLHAKTTLDT